MKKILSFIGAPGCGKGYMIDCFIRRSVQSGYCLKTDIEVISIGEIIRSEIKNKTAWGEQIKASKKSGCMAPDYLIIPLLQKKLNETTAGIIILDGYPRSMQQLNSLTDKTENSELNFIFRDTPEYIIRKRIAERRICATCGAAHTVSDGSCQCGGRLVKRKEDTNFEERLEEYKTETLPVINTIRKINTCYVFSGVDFSPAHLNKLIEAFYGKDFGKSSGITIQGKNKALQAGYRQKVAEIQITAVKTNKAYDK